MSCLYNNQNNKNKGYRPGSFVIQALSEEEKRKKRTKIDLRIEVFKFVNKRIREGKSEEQILTSVTRCFIAPKYDLIRDELENLARSSINRYKNLKSEEFER